MGWDPVRIARAWGVLMKRIGYTRYVAQGGDWGSPVSNEMARLALPELLGIHVNLPGVCSSGRITTAPPVRLTAAGRPVCRRRTCLQAARTVVFQATCLCADHGDAPANSVRPGGFPFRPGILAARSWGRVWSASGGDNLRGGWTHDQRTFRRCCYARRRARQRHALLADKHSISSARLYWENRSNLYLRANVSIPRL